MDLPADLASLAAQLVAKGPEPIYLNDLRTVRQRAGELKSFFPSAFLLYAVKANSNPHVVRTIIEAGFGIETVSVAEVMLALALGAKRVLFTANNVCDEEFAAVLALSHAAENAGRIWINVDSESRLSKVPSGQEVFLRVNGPVGSGHCAKVVTCGPDSKFGIAHERLPAVLQSAHERGVKVVGLHQHIGSGVLEVSEYMGAASILLQIVESPSNAAHLHHLRFVDVGGGIGVPYRPGAKGLDLATLGPALTARFEETKKALAAHRGSVGGAGPDSGDDLTMVMEPGRYLVADSGWLLAKITTIKPTPYGRVFVGVNSGFNHLIRPMAYGSFHRITRLNRWLGLVAADAADRADADETDEIVIAGNICESGDVFTPEPDASRTADLKGCKEGEWLVLHTAGSYGFSMASEYNMRPKPAEFIVDESKGRIAALTATGGGESLSLSLKRPGPVVEAEGKAAPLAALLSTKATTFEDVVRTQLSGGF